MDAKPKVIEDVDSIPIVRLEDMPSMPGAALCLSNFENPLMHGCRYIHQQSSSAEGDFAIFLVEFVHHRTERRNARVVHTTSSASIKPAKYHACTIKRRRYTS